jgi:hypothetical protein
MAKKTNAAAGNPGDDNKKSRAARKVKLGDAAKKAVKKQHEKPLAWRNNKKGTSGVFKALYRDVLENVPNNLRAPAKARLAVLREVLGLLRNTPKDVVDTGYVSMPIPWTMLEFPPGEVGRERAVDLGHIGHILQTYDEASANPPRVSVMPVYDDAGKLVDVHFYVTNGWHSRTICLERAYARRPADLRTGKEPIKIPVTVSVSETLADLATSFGNQNDEGVRPMAKRDSWRNVVVAENEAAIYAVEVAAEYGFNAAAPKGKRGWEYFHNGDILRRLIDGANNQLPFGTEKAVRRALELVSNPDCVGIYGNKASLKPNFFGGLTALASLKIIPGYLHNVGLVHVMSRPDFHTRVNEQEATMSKERICVILDVPAKDVGRGENIRYLSYAAAILEVYKQSVPRPMAKTGTWPDCPPDLRRLLYEAPEITDEKERAKLIAQLTNRLNKLRGKRKPKGFTR